MNFTQLEYFLTIAQTGSITAAARQLFISQQTLSESLRRLEDELGVTLIHRTRPIALTEAGQCVADGARDILARKVQMLQQLETSTDNDGLVIYVAPTASPPFLTKLLLSFGQSCPTVKASVQVLDETSLLSTGVCFSLTFAELDKRLSWYPVLRDNYAVLIRPELLDKRFGPNADALRQGLRETGDLALLRTVPFAIPASPPSHPGPTVDALQRAGIDSASIQRIQQPHLVHVLCESGAAAAIAPLSSLYFGFERQIADGSLELFPLAERYGSYLLHIGCRKHCKPQSIEQQFIRFTQEFMEREIMQRK